MDNTVIDLVTLFTAAVSGIVIGKWLEAAKWREKAENGRERESGGSLYSVKKTWPIDPLSVDGR